MGIRSVNVGRFTSLSRVRGGESKGLPVGFFIMVCGIQFYDKLTSSYSNQFECRRSLMLASRNDHRNIQSECDKLGTPNLWEKTRVVNIFRRAEWVDRSCYGPKQQRKFLQL